MNNILAFHKSVQGSNHIEWGRPCEDASGSYANLENSIIWQRFQTAMAQMNVTVQTKVQRLL